MPEDMELAQRRIRDAYEAFNRGDYDGAVRHAHPDVEWHRVAGVESELKGREAVRGNLDPDVFGKQQVEIHRMEAIGDSLVVDATFHAEGRGSGVELDQRGYHLWEIKDGMGARFRFFLDRDEAITAAREAAD